MILLIIASIGRTQNYPVQAFVQLTPPYSSYLPDYSDPFNNQLKVLLTLTDFSIPSYQVKLRFKIEGQGYTIESADLINFSTITLSPGVPVEISGSSLAPYLATNNLVFSGIDAASYEQNKLLPEGPATICVEVIDALGSNQSVIGNPSCAQSWFFKHDPPLLNTPFCGTEITPTDPQMVLFSWTPLHMSSPNAGQTQYKFELFEVQNEGDDPNLVVNSPPFAMSTQITTNNFINYGIADNALVVGKTYVWRVQAMDPSGRDLYNNQGFSQVCTFTYGNVAASLLDGVTLELETFGTGVRQGTANWNASGTFDSYVLEVRKTGNSAYEWFPHEVLTGQKKVNSLDPETEYEARVKGIANGAETDWSNISTFTTLPEPEYECGDASQPGQSPQFVPLDFLLPSHIVDIGQFSMTVTSAEPSGTAPGHFKGYGRVFIPFIFSNVNVGFDDITVDDNMKMVDGKVEALTQGVDQWLANMETTFIDGIISNFLFNEQDSIVTVVLDNGDTMNFEWPPDGETLTFEDDSGLIYTVNSDGTVTISGSITWDDDHLDATANHQIQFKASPNQACGFDDLVYMQWTEQYPCIQLDDGGKYFVSYKSVGSNYTDKVYAIIKSDQTFTPTFMQENATGGGSSELSATQINDTTYEVTVGNRTTHAKIYAYNGPERLGKMNLSVYTQKQRDVVVIPVNGASVPDASVLQDSLNKVYAQSNAFFTVTVANNFNYTYDLNGNGLDGADDNVLSNYSEEMKALRDAYFDSTNAENKYYLFVVNDIEGDLDGYMVRGKSVGFIQTPANGIHNFKTYAHELAHGAFGLAHTFPAIPVEGTNNLLDYGSGSFLTHHQWYDIQHFNPVFSIFDDAEDGALVTVSDMSVLEDFKNSDGTYTFLSKSGKPITLPSNTSKVAFTSFDDFWKKNGEEKGRIKQIGSLSSFTFSDSTFIGSKSGSFFDGYKYKISQGNLGYVYKDKLTINHNVKHIITGLPCIKIGDNFHFYIYLISKDNFPETSASFNNQNYTSSGNLMTFDQILTAFSNVTNPNGVMVSATVSDEYDNELKSVLKYLKNVQCGLDFIFSMKSADLLAANPETFECFDGIAENAMSAFGSEWLRNYMKDRNGNLIISDLDDIPEEHWLNTTSAKRAKYLYETIWNYTELIENKELSWSKNYDLNSYDPYSYAVTNIWEWIYTDEEGNKLTREQALCALSKIHIDYRLDMIHTCYSTDYIGHLGSDKEQMMVDLIRSTPDKADFDVLMDFMKETADGEPKFWKIYDDCSMGEIQDFVYTVTEKMIEHGYYGEKAYGAYGTWETNPSPTNVPMMSPHYLSITKINVQYEQDEFGNNKHRFVSENNSDRDGNNVLLTYETECTYCSSNDGCIDAEDTHTKNLFELMRIDIYSDMQFQHPYLERKLKRGDFLIVPAFYAYWLIRAQEFVENTAVARSLVAIAASILSVATMNPGPALAFELAWNATELVIANIEDAVLSSDNEVAQELIEIYNYASLAVGGYFLLRGAVGIGNKVFIKVKASSVRAKIANYKNMSISGLTPEEYVTELNALAKYYKFLNKNKALIKDLSATEIKNVRQLYYEAHINSWSLKPNSKDLKLYVEDGVFGDAIKVVDQNLNKVEIGGVGYSDELQTPYAIIESQRFISREINSTDEILGEMNNATFAKSGESGVYGDAELVIIKNSSGEIKVKIVSGGSTLNDMLAKFASYPKIHAWISDGTIPFDILSKLDEWIDVDPAIISKFDSDLSTIPQLQSKLIESPDIITGWKRLIDAPNGIRQNLNILEDVTNWPSSWQINPGNVAGTIDVLDNGGLPLARIYEDKIVAPGRSILGQPGNKLLNRVPPIKNMTYEVDGILYLTDNLGRVYKTSGDLDDMIRIRLGNQQIRAVDIKDGIRGTDQGGHIIGARFFGAGEQINYYPQTANLNQGAWKDMENLWATEMVAGKDVQVEVNALFSGSSSRPDNFQVNYWVDGVKKTEFFENL